MPEIARRELCTYTAQEVDKLRTAEATFDFHFSEPEDASAAIDRTGLGHSCVLFARPRCLRRRFGARLQRGRGVEVRVLLWRSRVRRLRPPRGFRLSKRDGSEEAESERDEESSAARAADTTARHFPPAFAPGTGALGGGGATGGGGGGSGFITLR